MYFDIAYQHHVTFDPYNRFTPKTSKTQNYRKCVKFSFLIVLMVSRRRFGTSRSRLYLEKISFLSQSRLEQKT